MGFVLKHSTEADLEKNKKVYYYLLLHLFDVWQLLIQRHILHWTSMQFKVKYVFFFPRLQCFEYSSCRSKLKTSILTLVKLKFQYTRRHVNKICFVCVMYLMLHQVRNQPLWTNCRCYCELSLPVIPLMSLRINSVIFKSHEDKGTWANC